MYSKMQSNIASDTTSISVDLYDAQSLSPVHRHPHKLQVAFLHQLENALASQAVV